MPPLSVPAAPLIGRTIDGRFKILELLGEGGMGQVYLAEQTSIGRKVALKVLSPLFGDEDRIKDRFRNEAALASRLNHPNTVIIYDFGLTEDGLMFIAMEFIEGKSLRDELDLLGAMDWRRVVGIVRQICGSLQDAHEKAIIHRDLKPENIMLLTRSDATDVVKVLDFGVAKILSDTDRHTKRGLTAPNEIFGTPEYMSPEQARGDEMSPSTDIYSLGIILYRMLSGELPFDGNTPIAILAKHLADTPPKLETADVSPVIPVSLCETVTACLAKVPEARPSSMKDLAAALDAIVSAEDGRMKAGPDVSAAGIAQPRHVDAALKADPRRASDDGSDGDAVGTPVRGTAMLAGGQVDSSFGINVSVGEVSAPDRLPEELPEVDTRSPKEQTLDKLMARIRSKKEFPAVSRHISELNTKVSNDDTSASQLSNVILKDTSLTAKLIRLANSPYYGGGRGQITMVSRAVVLMGFDAVREAALGLLLFDHLQSTNPTQAAELRETAVGSLMGAIIAKEQAKQLGGVNKEEAFVCAMFHNLGKHAAIFYLPDEMGAVRAKMENGTSEDDAFLEVFGVSMDELGQALARQWDFPEQILSTMRKVPDGPLKRAKGKGERLHFLSSFSSELVKAAAITDPSLRKLAFTELAGKYGTSLKLDVDGITTLMDDSLEKIEDYARQMNLRPSESELLKKMLVGAGKHPALVSEAPVDVARLKTTDSGKLTRPSDMAEEEYHAVIAEIAAEELAAKERVFEEGLAEVSASIRGRFDLNGVMLMVLETMYRGLGLNRVIFCLNDVRTKTLRGRFGFGENVEELIPIFHFPAMGRSDVFTHAMSTGEDAIVVNRSDRPLPLKIPLWYKNLIDAPQFLLFPIRVQQFPAALFYGDLKDSDLEIRPVLMTQMRELRDHAVRAMETANTPRGGRGRK